MLFTGSMKTDEHKFTLIVKQPRKTGSLHALTNEIFMFIYLQTTKPIKDIYLKEFTNLNERISTLLSSARRDCLNSIEDFVSDKVRKMGSIMTFYHNIFCNLDVQNRKELDNKISQLYGDKEIRESVDELIELESEWDEFLEGVDKKLNGDKVKNELAVGDQGPCELMLTDVRTERCVCIFTIHAAFA